VLIGLAALTTVIDRLNERGVGLADLARGGTDIDAAAAEVAGQSPVAARMLDRLRQVADLDARPLQLSLGSQNRVAA
jgi:ABC-type arginine transport system ATPase subunit